MNDEEILEELTSQKRCWEKNIEECSEKLNGYKKELFKTNRLIELVQNRIKEKQS